MSLTNFAAACITNNNATQPETEAAENQIHLIILSSFLLANILMAWILVIYNQHRLKDQINILVLLQIHMNKMFPATNMVIILPILIRLGSGPMSHIVAEIMVMLMNVMVCHLIILTVASSIIKLLLVANFDLVFSLDCQKLVTIVTSATASVALIPNVMFTLWVLLAQRHCSNITVAFLVGSTLAQFSVNFVMIYLLMWLLMSLTLVAIVALGIPAYLKRVHTSLAIREQERNVINTFFLKSSNWNVKKNIILMSQCVILKHFF